MERKCPYHMGNPLTPTDSECHNHSSDTQQRIHNLHCNILRCRHALWGKERHPDAVTHEPRTLTEKLFKLLG